MQTIAAAVLLSFVVYLVSANPLLRHAFEEHEGAPSDRTFCCIPKQVETTLVTVGPGDHDRHRDDDQDIELSEDGDANRRNLVDMVSDF